MDIFPRPARLPSFVLVTALMAGPAFACGSDAPASTLQPATSRIPAAQCELLLARIQDVHRLHPEACRRGAPADPAFCRLVALGKPADACLLEKMTDTRRMTDPGCPQMSGGRYAVGDSAYHTLVAVHGLTWDAPFPARVRARIDQVGAHAYYDYVNDDPGARRHLRDWVKGQLESTSRTRSRQGR